MSETLALTRIPLDEYAELLGAGEIEELRALAKPLRGRSMEMINSTAVGGGVAEILNRLVSVFRSPDGSGTGQVRCFLSGSSKSPEYCHNDHGDQMQSLFRHMRHSAWWQSAILSQSC